jgi:hypothetical protein
MAELGTGYIGLLTKGVRSGNPVDRSVATAGWPHLMVLITLIL